MDHRHSSPSLPRSPRSANSDFQRATVAMERAAEAMIAVTESFRQQLQWETGGTTLLVPPTRQQSASPSSAHLQAPRPRTYHASWTTDDRDAAERALWLSEASPREWVRDDSSLESRSTPPLESPGAAVLEPRADPDGSESGGRAGESRRPGTAATLFAGPLDSNPSFPHAPNPVLVAPAPVAPFHRPTQSFSRPWTAPVTSEQPSVASTSALPPARSGSGLGPATNSSGTLREPPDLVAEDGTITETVDGATTLLGSMSPRTAEPAAEPTVTATAVAKRSPAESAAAAPAPVIRTGPRHGTQRPQSRASHVDLLEASSRISSNHPSRAHKPGSTKGGSSQTLVQYNEELPRVYTSDSGAATLKGSKVRIAPVNQPLMPPAPSATTDQRPSRPANMSLGHEVFFVLTICFAQMLMLSGLAQAMVPARIIGQSFPDTTPGDMAWYSAAYGLTSGTFVLPAGRLGDVFGHKKVFIVGFLWFALWSLVAGFAELAQRGGLNGTIFFCTCRALQGIGPAVLVPNGQAMLGRTYAPGKRKNLVMSLFGAAAPFGFVAGAAVASLLAVEASWPWAFWSLAAVCICITALSVLCLPSEPPAAEKPRGAAGGVSLWARLDVYGIMFGVSGLVLLNFAVNQAPIVSWTTPYTYFVLIIGVMLLGAFVYTERVVSYPLVPLSALRSTTSFVLGCTGAGWGCFGVWVYYAFNFLEVLRGWSPLLSTAGFAHAPVAGLAASLLTAQMMGKVRPHWIMLLSMCAFLVGSLLWVTAPVEQSFFFGTFFGILIMPFGMDMSNPAATILLSNSVSKEHQGIAASLVATVVNYSISLALGIAGTVEISFGDNGSDVLAGYRAAQYFGLGLGGLGVALAAAFLLQSYRQTPRRGQSAV